MWNPFKRLFAVEPVQLMLSGTGPVRVSVERLDRSFTLHLTGEAKVTGGYEGNAAFSIEISDTASLRDMCEMVHRTHRADPPSPPYVDTSLLPDEPDNIYEDISRTLGPMFHLEWLDEPNVHFGGETPHKVIRNGEAFRVRILLRQIKHCGMS